jgi:copper(I)-binding protein
MIPLPPAALTLSLGLTLLLTGCGNEERPAQAARPDDIQVKDAWVRATTGSRDATMTGAFMEISNQGDEAVRLTGATSSVARKVEVHTMVMKGDKMVMRQIEGGLEIEAGSHVHLRPGGDHVMLMGLSDPLAAGDEVDLSLAFDDGTEEEVTAPVKTFTEEEDHYEPSTSPSPSMTPVP